MSTITGPCVTPLVYAAEDGDINTVKWHMQNGADPKKIRHAASMAAKGGHAEVLKILLENGADVNVTEKYMLTPLNWACMNGHSDCVQLLMDNGADHSIQEPHCGTSVVCAMANGHLECLKMVLNSASKTCAKRHSKGGKPSDEDVYQYFYQIVQSSVEGIGLAMKNKHRYIVDYVMNEAIDGIDVNVDISTETGPLLCCAAETEMKDVVSALLAKGANVNGNYERRKISSSECSAPSYRKVGDKDEQTLKSPLMWAAEKGNLDIVKILCENGADINLIGPCSLQHDESEGQYYMSAVYLAAKEGHSECLQFLLNLKPKPKALWNPGYAALLETMCNSNAECVKLLLKNGLDPNKKHNWPRLCHFPLSKACYMGYVNCGRILIQHGARLNNVDKHGPPLVLSLQNMQYEMIDMLLEYGSSVNTAAGTTSALKCAVQLGDVDIVKKLLTKGADPNIPCAMGETPIFIAADLGQTECLKVLLTQKDIIVNVLNERGCTAIIGAIRNQKLDCVSVLLKHGLSPNLCQPWWSKKYTCFEGNLYPLMWAIHDNYPSCVEFLLSYGADPSLVNLYSQNSYEYAVSQDRPACLKLLLDHATEKQLLVKQKGFKSVLQKFRNWKCNKSTVEINELLIESMTTYPRTSADCAKVILAYDVNINYRNSRNMSSLDFAAERLLLDHAKLLLSHNADITPTPKKHRNLMSHIGVDGIVGQIDASSGRMTDSFVQMKSYLLAAGCQSLEKYQQVPEQLQDFSDLLAHNFELTLQNWCRRKIRRHILSMYSGNLFCYIPHLPLPKSMISYLLYGQSLEQGEEPNRDSDVEMSDNTEIKG